MKNGVLFLMLTLCFLVAIDIAVRFWFLPDLHLVFNPENLNNIVTPIAAVLSLLVLSYLAYWQNRTIQSHNLKEQFVSEIATIKLLMEKKTTTGSRNSFEYIDAIADFFVIDIHINTEYMLDVREIMDGKVRDFKFYQTRSYYPPLKTVMGVATFGIPGFARVETLANEFKSAPMLGSDRTFVRRMIMDELAGKLIHVMQFMPNEQITDGSGHIMVASGGKVSAIHIRKSKIGETYGKLKENLE